METIQAKVSSVTINRDGHSQARFQIVDDKGGSAGEVILSGPSALVAPYTALMGAEATVTVEIKLPAE
jgi:hypothetical protein